MKVLMVNSVCGIGSTGRICTDLAEVLESHGHEVRIAYGRGEVPKNYARLSYRIGNDFSVRINGAKARLFDNEGFNAGANTRRFLKWANSYNPDILHLHNLHGYYLNVEVLFNWIKSRPNMKVVWTIHDCWAFTGHCSHFDFVGCDRWKTGCHNCPQTKEYPKSYFDFSKRNYERKKRVFTGVSNMTLVTPSDWLLGVVEKSFLGVYPAKTIRNGIDLSVFKTTESNIKERLGVADKKIILGVANVWNERKGFFDFIKLSEIVSDDYIIMLVGVTAEQKKTLPKNIIGIERTNNVRELAEIYTAADVFVNPSVEETMGLTTAEALACGTPAVVYNKTAVPEVVSESSGVVLSENTPEAIKSAVENLCLTSDGCAERAKEFDKTKKYSEYLKLYESMTEKKGDRCESIMAH